MIIIFSFLFVKKLRDMYGARHACMDISSSTLPSRHRVDHLAQEETLVPSPARRRHQGTDSPAYLPLVRPTAAIDARAKM